MVDKIYNIKYVDAHYTYAKSLGETKLFIFEAYGYIEKKANNVIVTFIKKRGTSNKEIIGEVRNIIKGLIIPDTALLSTVDIYDNKVLKNVTEGLRVAVTWRDVVYIANLPRYDCSIMYTEGILTKIEKDHIVLKNPETIRTYPKPVKNHPVGEHPTYLMIPVSLVTEITGIRQK